MDALDQLVAQVQALSGSEQDVAHLSSLLKQADELLRTHALRLPFSLSSLHPTKHSLGYLYLLEAQSSGTLTREQSDSFLALASSFLTVCAPEQIRLAPDKFNSVCRRLRDQAMHLHEPMRAILPLQCAIRKLQPSSEYLTAIHADYLQMCLLSKCYKASLSILEDDIFEIDQKKTSLVPRDFLLYCYYGGMIYIGLKKFSKALEFFQHAITAPTTALNAITIAAFGKYVLVSLIQNGQVPPFPKYTPAVVLRNLKSCVQDYLDLANLYASRNIAEVKRCITQHEEVFKNQDNNLGLAKQVIASLYKRNIQRLTQTYLTLSLQDIANTVQLDDEKDAELHILQMIKDGDIFAAINQKDGMVSFQEDPEQYNTCDMTQRLNNEIHHIVCLAKKLTWVDEQVSCDHAYLSKIGRDRPRYDEDFDLVPQKIYTNI
ncbi:COP9 signalosome complex subunit 3 isoform X1 [Physcomitrium patens]|uniref:COP9 signalosome complex subunit 3 isoform X1 n=1 Tax=Physcomitrium patens TaxID=3218 RepID=UPI003CCCBA5D